MRGNALLQPVKPPVSKNFKTEIRRPEITTVGGRGSSSRWLSTASRESLCLGKAQSRALAALKDEKAMRSELLCIEGRRFLGCMS